MTLTSELQYFCNQRSLARAHHIAASCKNILTKQVRYDGEETVVSAFVASSSGWDDRYRTSVTIDDDTIIDYSCTCPAYLQYDGMCKHCAALVIDFDANPQTFLGYRDGHAPATSACIADFMRKAHAAAQAADTSEGEPGKEAMCAPASIDIETIVAYEHRTWSAHFKVAGPQGTYAIKSISEFVDRMRTGEFFSYGKKLAFAHTPTLFTEHARALMQFLERACDLREQTSAAAYWRYRNANIVGRNLDLSEIEAVELFDLLAAQARPFALELATYPKKSTTMARIREEDPAIPLAIKPYDKGGYVMERSGSVAIAAQGDRMYLMLGAVLYRCSREFARCADFLRSVYNNDNERLFISKQDMPLFCATVLPLVESTLQLEAPQELKAFKPVSCNVEFFFDKEDEVITCSAHAIYGEQRFVLCGTDGQKRADGGNVDSKADDSHNEHVGENSSGSEQADASNGNRANESASESTGESASEAIEPLRDERKELRATNLVSRYFAFDPASAKNEHESEGGNRRKRNSEARRTSQNDSSAHSSNAVIPLSNDDAVAKLLFGGLAEFRTQGNVFTTPAFDRLISDKKPKVTLGVSLAGNLIDLTVSADDLPSRELSALLGSYRKRKRFHRLKSGAYLDLHDFDLSQLDRIASDLGLTAKELAAGHAELPAYRAFYLDEETDIKRDRSFSRYLENFRKSDEAAYTPPATMANVLRPYQTEGFRWLSARCDAGFGGILADEMGLGKSIQLISLLLARQSEARATGPSLIVCPASLVYNWLAEIKRFAPELTARVVVGTKYERALVRKAAFARFDAPTALAAATPHPAPKSDGTSNSEQVSRGDAQVSQGGEQILQSSTGNEQISQSGGGAPCDVLITSYDLLRIDIADWCGHAFFCCALDEAHYIKNPATLTTRAAKRIEAKHRFALTGTPLENRLSELWSIFDFLMPGLLGPYARFRDRFEEPIVGGDEESMRRLQAAIGPFMLRRLKKDVLADLPEKLESNVFVSLEGEQKKLYAAHEQRLRESLTAQHNTRKERNDGKRKVEILAELTKLRQLCCDPSLLYENYTGPAAKLDAIEDLVAAAQDAGEKMLVFSQFTSFLSRIASRLDAQGVPYFTITGSTPKARRLQLVNTFNEDETPVFLVSLKAGGTGLNLTGASVVIHADPWWNEAAQTQATDRAHRIGQTRVVSVQKVIAKGTIEERILKLQQDKSALAHQVMGAGGVSLASLSAEDIAGLLSDE